MTGNFLTLVMVVLAAPLFRALHLSLDTRAFVGSAGFILATSMAVVLFRGRLFTLKRRELSLISAMHMVRITMMIGLGAVMWHIMLPAVALQWWILLGAVRQLLSRLPPVPNKDFVFAGVAACLIGKDADITAAVTLLASLILATHFGVGLLVTGGELVRERGGKARTVGAGNSTGT